MHVPRWVISIQAVAGVMAGVAVAPARAQSRGSVAGTITDLVGIPIAGAQVTLRDRGLMTVSDSRGTFKFDGVTPGSTAVRVRRLGFRPETVTVSIAPSPPAMVSLKLEAIAAALSPVIVRATSVKHEARLVGFYERKEQKTAGHFITYQEIESEAPRSMSHLLQRVPALTVVKGRAGATGVRTRGRTCWPLVWLDGFPMPAGEVDLDSFSPAAKRDSGPPPVSPAAIVLPGVGRVRLPRPLHTVDSPRQTGATTAASSASIRSSCCPRTRRARAVSQR